jgi:hypothetical protein
MYFLPNKKKKKIHHKAHKLGHGDTITIILNFILLVSRGSRNEVGTSASPACCCKLPVTLYLFEIMLYLSSATNKRNKTNGQGSMRYYENG